MNTFNRFKFKIPNISKETKENNKDILEEIKEETDSKTKSDNIIPSIKISDSRDPVNVTTGLVYITYEISTESNSTLHEQFLFRLNKDMIYFGDV